MPAQKTLVIQMLKHGFNLNLLLSIAKLAHSTYYYHAKRLAVPDKYADLVAKIKAIYAKNRGRYGYRRITDELRNRGHVVNHKTVQRPMRQHGIICCVRIKNTNPTRVKWAELRQICWSAILKQTSPTKSGSQM